jgi:DNA-binding transcriptional ArsR family regulator
MPDISSETFSVDQLEDMSELLRAIAHPLRIMIIDLLKDGKQLTVSQIQKELHIEQAVASHHLIILKNKDVLNAHRSGKTILYYLRNEYISQLVFCARQAV